MPFQYVNGKLVRLVEQEVASDDEVEQQLQSELEASQNELNTHQANLANAEQAYANAEAQATAAADELDKHKDLVEEATARVQKSTDDHASFAAARQLRDAGVGAEPETEDIADVDGEPSNSVEEKDLSDRITVAAGAEG